MSLRAGTFSTFPEAVLSHSKGDAEDNAEKGSTLYVQEKTQFLCTSAFFFWRPPSVPSVPWVPPDGAAVVHLQRRWFLLQFTQALPQSNSTTYTWKH